MKIRNRRISGLILFALYILAPFLSGLEAKNPRALASLG